jgi:hypothetical protein
METLDDQTREVQLDPSVLMTLRLLRKYNHDGGTNYGLLNFVGALVLFAAAAYLLAVAAGTAELLGDRTIKVGERGFAAALEWARGLGPERVWALEDCRHVSGALEDGIPDSGVTASRRAALSLPREWGSARCPLPQRLPRTVGGMRYFRFTEP